MSMSKSQRLRRARKRAATQKAQRAAAAEFNQTFFQALKDSKRRVKAPRSRAAVIGQRQIEKVRDRNAGQLERQLYGETVTVSANPRTIKFEPPTKKA